MTNENKDFWLARWQRGETGWHQDAVEPALVKWATKRKPSKILVPLCGKSLDLIWLASNGFDVIGVELSEIACEALFTENKIPFKKSRSENFNIFEGKGLKIFNGDFFSLAPKLLGSVSAVYDRAALIALPEEMRKKYSTHLFSLIGSGIVDFLQIIIHRTPHDLTGPPYSVPMSEVEALYGKHFKITLQSKEFVTARAPEGSKTEECVLTLEQI
jgi:thiopurine S-methyltransferase